MSANRKLTASELPKDKGNSSKPLNPLGYMPMGKLLLSFSLPAIIQVLINAIYNIVDQIFIGQGVGYFGNAATTVAFPIMTLILACASMLGSGGATYASIKLGQGKGNAAEKALTNQYVLSVFAGVAITVLGIVFLKPLLLLFGATDSIMPYAVDYASVILMGAPFSVLGISLSHMARTDGSPQMSMYSVLIGALLNCVLDPVYIFVFGWGVKGAAIATITSQMLTALILTVYFVKYGKHMKLRTAYITPSFKTWRRIVTLGFSAAIRQGDACLVQITMNHSLVYYGNLDPQVGGDIALSAMGIVMKVVMILGAFGLGIGLGSLPIFGFNYGAREPQRIKKCYFLAVGVSTLLILMGWTLCQLFPEQLLSLFGNANASFHNFAIKNIRIFTFGIILAGFQMVSIQYFQATGQPVKASLLAMLRQLLLLVPLVLILPRFFGLDGILYAGPAADICAAFIVFCFMKAEMKKIDRWIITGNLEGELAAVHI